MFPNTAHSGISSYPGEIAHQLQVRTQHTNNKLFYKRPQKLVRLKDVFNHTTVLIFINSQIMFDTN
jgi:hypothetical protein